MMKSKTFVDKLIDVAKNHKTLYVMGCFGAPLTGNNVTRYCTNHAYNKQSAPNRYDQGGRRPDPTRLRLRLCLFDQRRPVGVDRRRRPEPMAAPATP